MRLFLILLLFPWMVFSQNQTTGNLVYSTVNPAPEGAQYNWSGFTVYGTTQGGLSGGNVPNYNTSTGTFYFGYGQATIAYTMAVNSALSGTGIQISGINYGLQYYNQEFNRGTLSTNVSLYSSTGSLLRSYSHSLGQTTQGWTNFDQTQSFNDPYSLASLGNVSMTFSGRDDRFWAGYYGPMVRNPYITFNYTADVCASNPLSSPECPGYAAAYLTQQCNINPLYSPSCPNYLSAQCNINPLFSQACPGYAAAYFTQQCNLDGLYSTQCPNYGEAYAKKNILNVSTPSSSQPSTSVSSDGKVKTEVSKTGDSTVDSAIENKTTSSTPNPTAPVQLTSSGGQSVNSQTGAQAQQTRTQTSPSSSTSDRQSSQRQEREQKDNKSSSEMKQAAQQRAQQEMKKAETANNFEAQVAVQTNVIAAMGFVPGFNAYAQANVPDVLQLQLQRQYGKETIDNRRAFRLFGGGQERLHQEMVDGQYNR